MNHFRVLKKISVVLAAWALLSSSTYAMQALHPYWDM